MDVDLGKIEMIGGGERAAPHTSAETLLGDHVLGPIAASQINHGIAL
jgi:hypothetical protein